MNPVSGPTTVVLKSGTVAPKAWSRILTRYKQVKPFNLNLPYKSLSWKNISVSKGVRYDAGVYGGSTSTPVTFDNTGDAYYSYFTSYENAAITKAITKFNKEQATKASMGIAMAEARQSTNMFLRRLGQAVSVVKALKRFDLKSASQALGLQMWQAKRNHREWVRSGKGGPYSIRGEDIWNKNWDKERRSRRRAQAFADLWLEFSFGWMPLVDDIHSAIEVLEKSVYYPNPIKAGGSLNWSFTSSSVLNDTYWLYNQDGKHAVKTMCAVGGVLTVSNPNIGLASRLGLTNPASIVYELINFSFVLNYFINIEEYINQFSQYHGVTVSQAWYSIVWDDTIDYVNKRTYKPTGVVTIDRAYVANAKSMKRVVGSLPNIKLGLRSSYHNGLKRGLNNAALLVQLLQRKR